MLEFVVGGIIGFLSGFAIRVLYDEVKEPKLFIDDDEKHLECVWVYPEGKPPMYICRIFVYNKKKRILNYVAKNCIAWVKSTKKETKEQISWVGGSSLDINVDDYQKVNLFAIVKGTNNFAFGTEKDETNLRPPYFEPNKESVEFILKIGNVLIYDSLLYP